MNKNSEDFSIQEAKRLANSPAGQQLFALLQRTQGEQLQQAMDAAAAGNYGQMQKAMASLLSSPEAQQLLRQMGKG
ncbi:MAG TPA: hypothetical protein IAC31_09890 [Candidatus Faecousia intestinigallinarum]|nr:hypothetical protein [Candidatus Faecousia intestinigallinarum]